MINTTISAVLSLSVMPDSATPLSVPHQSPLSMGCSRQQYWSGLPCPHSQDLPNPGVKLRSFTLQADSLPSEPPGKPKNTGVGSLSLLQGSFLNQESNQCLLHCRWLLYQLSYLESPIDIWVNFKELCPVKKPFPKGYLLYLHSIF